MEVQPASETPWILSKKKKTKENISLVLNFNVSYDIASQILLQ